MRYISYRRFIQTSRHVLALLVVCLIFTHTLAVVGGVFPRVYAVTEFIGGQETFTGNGGADQNYTYCDDFTASDFYTLQELRWYQTDAYLFDVGIYDDNAGVPGTRIDGNTGTGVTGTNTLSVTGSITSGETYWLCKAMIFSDLYLKYSPGNSSLSKATGPSLPSSFTGSFDTVVDYVPNMGAWGEIFAPTATPTPTPTGPATPTTEPVTTSLVEVYITTLSENATEYQYNISIKNRSTHRVQGLITISPFACILCNLMFLSPLEPGQEAVLDDAGRYNKQTPDFYINFVDAPDTEKPVIYRDGIALNGGVGSTISAPIVPESCSDINLFGFDVPDYFCMFRQWMWSALTWIFGIDTNFATAKFTELEDLAYTKVPWAYINAFTDINAGATNYATPGAVPNFTFPAINISRVDPSDNTTVINTQVAPETTVMGTKYSAFNPAISAIRTGILVLIIFMFASSVVWYLQRGSHP